MPALLTVFSVLAAWSFLAVVGIGLLVLVKALQSIRRWNEQIVVGLRAVEHHTASLGTHVGVLCASLGDAVDAVGAAERGISSVSDDLGQVAAPPRYHGGAR